MTKVLTPLAALAFAFGVQAAVPSVDGFESYAENASVTNATGWSFTAGSDGADDASFVTTYTTAGIAAPATCPDGTTAGSNFLKLSTEDGMLFRNMDGDSGQTVQLNAGLYVDTDVQFTITDPSDRPEVTADDKFIIWLEDQGASGTNLCVWAKQFTATDGSTSKSNTYTLVANDGTALNITPGAWYRLTVKALSSVGTGVTFPAFQVYLNGSLLKTSGFIMDGSNEDVAALDTAVGGNVVMSQEYFPAMADSLSSLSKVGFSGEGAIDNVVVTKEVPGFEDPTTLTFVFDESVISSIDITALGVSVSSSGATLRVAPGQTFNMEINWLSGYSTSTHTLTTASSSDVYATVSDLAVSALACGSATITLTTTAKDTVGVTFDWSELLTTLAGANKLSDLTSIAFTVGSDTTTYTLSQMQTEYITSATLNDLKVNTNITVTVTIAQTWAPAFEQVTPGTATLSNSDNVFTITARGDGAATVNISVAAAPAKVTVSGDDTPYYTLAEALAAATAGSTITLQANLDGTPLITTAADAIDLNGYTITGTKAISLTGAGDKTIKGGEFTGSGCYDVFYITNPANQSLTLDGVTFHASVQPIISGDVLFVTNCNFLCDIAKNGSTAVGQDFHSYGLILASANCGRVDIVDNQFQQGRRSAVEVCCNSTPAPDVYFYGNTVDGSADRLTTSERNQGRAFPALQIFKNGRVFIENNTFTGSFMGEPFALYNEGANISSSEAIVFNGNTVDNSVPYLWGFYESPDTPLPTVTNAPNLFFGSNTIGESVDKTQGKYKAQVDPVPVAWSELEGTLALPTGVATVYAWTHAAGAQPYDINGSAASNLSEVEDGDVIIAVPGAAAPVDDTPTGIEYTAATPFKNKWTAATAAAAGWVDDSSSITAGTTAAQQYSDLDGSALASADAKELTDWAKAKSIDYAAVVAAPGNYVEAFLLNCAVADVATEKAAFKANISVAADGTVTVTPTDGKDYNGTLQLKGKAALTDAEWTDVAAPSASYKFYKYELSL